MAIPKERCPTTGKLRWPNRREARDELRHAHRTTRQASKGQVREDHEFHCLECDGWHLTSWSKRTYLKYRDVW